MRDFQGALYRLEHGGGVNVVRAALAVLAFCALAFLYQRRYYRNFQTEEAMDTAQLARNIAEGNGFSTLYVRPFSIYLLSRHGVDVTTLVNRPHPDIANAPGYPLLLAGYMKAMPFRFDIPSTQNIKFTTYQPELLISVLNQALFLVSCFVLFFLAQRLFDQSIAWITSIAFAGCEVYWQFAGAGLSTTLLTLWFLGLVACLLRFDTEVRAEGASVRRLLLLAAILGLVTAVGALTRYSVGWLLAPLLVFQAIYGGVHRAKIMAVTTAAFLVGFVPWLVRNYAVSGCSFGISGYALWELTPLFADDRLIRSIDPSSLLQQVGIWDLSRKFLVNLHEIVSGKLVLGGASILFGLFLAGFTVPFNNPALTRLRNFLVMILPVFVLVEAVVKTHVSTDTDGINSENLLVIFAPVTFAFGVCFFFTLVDALMASHSRMRGAALGAFTCVACLPMIATLFGPKSNPVAYPPYYPPGIRSLASYLNPSDAVMSDIPWAVAWYGHRRGIGLSLDSKTDFERIHVASKDLRALLLSARFMNSGLREMYEGNEGWGRIAFDIVARHQIPEPFPFDKVFDRLLPDQIFLSDTAWWEVKGASK